MENLILAENFSSSDYEKKDAQEIAVTPVYKQFTKEGETVVCRFLGFVTLETTDRTSGEVRAIKTGLFHAKDGFFYNSGINLVNQLEKINPVNSQILKITFEKTVNRCKIFKVSYLM